MDTDPIYGKLKISHNEYLKILEGNKDLFGKFIGQMEAEQLDNPIEDDKNKSKNNIVHSKGISDSYKNKYIDHMLFKKLY